MKWFMTTSREWPTVSASLGQFGIEERPGDDPERQTHQVRVRVADLAVSPGLEHPFGLIDHDRPVPLDLLVLEGRLGQPALPAQNVPSLVRSPSPTSGISHRVIRSFMKLSAWVRRTYSICSGWLTR